MFSPGVCSIRVPRSGTTSIQDERSIDRGWWDNNVSTTTHDYELEDTRMHENVRLLKRHATERFLLSSVTNLGLFESKFLCTRGVGMGTYFMVLR